MPVPELLRKHGISCPTVFDWRSQYGGASVEELMRLRLREREAEKAKLKRMYGALALENAAIKDVRAGKL